MKKTYKGLLLASLMVVTFSATSCEKTPDKGYLNDEEILEVIKSFETSPNYSRYTVKGDLNYLALKELDGCTGVNMTKEYFDTTDKFTRKAMSHTLGVPLKITEASWTTDVKWTDALALEEMLPRNEINFDSVTGEAASPKNPNVIDKLSLSTKYRLESSIIMTAISLSKCYYYKSAEGGLIVKTFAENKELKVLNPVIISCPAKWNITIEYNKYGLLVSEKFETINAHEDPDSETVYGEMTYEFKA